jgi:hypothetical protein
MPSSSNSSLSVCAPVCAPVCALVLQLKPDDLLKISQTTLEDILLCEAQAGLHSTAPASSLSSLPVTDAGHSQSTPHHPSSSSSTSASTLSARKRRGGSAGLHSPHTHQANHSSSKTKRRRTSHSMDDDIGDEEEEEEGMGGGRDRDRQSSRMSRNRNNRNHEEEDDEDDDDEGEGEGYDESSADGSPERHATAPLATGGTHTDRSGERNGEHEDDMSSLSRLMHNTAAATAHTNSGCSGNSNSNATPFGASNGDPTQLSADSGSSADRPYGGQGLGVEGNQLEYLEESFQLIALMVRGNAARIKDDMK